jgi:hypothetical protein
MRQIEVRLPGILCLRIAQTISSNVRSGSISISASKKSACFSSGDVLLPRGLAVQRPLSRKHFTQITAVLGLSRLPPRSTTFHPINHPLAQHADFLLALIEVEPDLTLDEAVCAIRENKIPGSRTQRSGDFSSDR